jgi:hypothetical protein
MNDNPFYQTIKNITLDNNNRLLRENDSTINQINNLIEAISNTTTGEKMVLSITEKPVLDNLLERKRALVIEEKYLQNNIQNKDDVISVIDANYAIEYDRTILEKSKKKLIPLLFVFLFSLYFLIKLIIKKGKQFVENQGS